MSDPIKGRREFLKNAVIAGGAVAATGGAGHVAAAENAEPTKPQSDAKPTGYRETDHVRTYYRLARF